VLQALRVLPDMRLLRLHLMRLYRSLWAHIPVQGGDGHLGLPPLADSASEARRRQHDAVQSEQPHMCFQVDADALCCNALAWLSLGSHMRQADVRPEGYRYVGWEAYSAVHPCSLSGHCRATGCSCVRMACARLRCSCGSLCKTRRLSKDEHQISWQVEFRNG
jgi:hypothetical protein